MGQGALFHDSSSHPDVCGRGALYPYLGQTTHLAIALLEGNMAWYYSHNFDGAEYERPDEAREQTERGERPASIFTCFTAPPGL
jgi:hypothetical protein